MPKKATTVPDQNRKAPDPNQTALKDCPVKTRSHEAHDNLIHDLVKEKLEQAARADQMASMVKAANAQSSKAKAELSALRESLKDSPDRTTKILANAVLELESELKKHG